MTDKVISTLVDFDNNAWSVWIENALASRFSPATPLPDEDVHETLVRVFSYLKPEAQQRFSYALAKIFVSVSVQPSNAEHLFYLLQAISVAVPREASSHVRKLLADNIGHFSFIRHKSKRTLQGTLLNAAAKYGIDLWLKDYMWRSSDEHQSFEYALLCTRLLSWRLDDSAYSFQQVLIPRFADEIHIAQYNKVFTGITKRVGLRFMLRWYQGADQFFAKLPGRAKTLWKRAILPVLSANPTDPYSRLLLTELQIPEVTPTPKDIVDLARLHAVTDNGLLAETLCRLQPLSQWQAVLPTDPSARAFRDAFTITGIGAIASVPLHSPEATLLNAAYARTLEAEYGLPISALPLEPDYV